MSIGIWEAVQILAGKDPEILAVFADEMAQLHHEVETLREVTAKLRLDMDRHAGAAKSDLARAVTDARRAAERALGDGWHGLSVWGEFLVRDGVIVAARCANASKREDVARVLDRAFGASLGRWNDDGEAEVCIPF